ncbi:hypothetical protein PSAB6_50213 [Paraburkholderia sabiae]|nr:hypothetical protein PSAB6_50213 [Paraburkholderia sabiae]
MSDSCKGRRGAHYAPIRAVSGAGALLAVQTVTITAADRAEMKCWDHVRRCAARFVLE